MGGHVNISQALIFKVVDSVAQGSYDWKLDSCGFFGLGTTELGEPANKGRATWFIVFTIKPGLLPPLEQSLHW
jgi:hypothetical protein